MGCRNYRHKVTIQTSTPTRDSYGGEVESWGTYKIMMCSIDPMAGREFFGSEQIQADTTHKIMMHYVAGVTAKMRVLFGSRVFDIQSVINPGEIGKDLILLAVEHDS